MPLQNRVTPFGELVAHPSKAAIFTGNRGIIHDPATKTLTGRRWTTKAWITCTCRFKGRRRDVWATRSWTELFFLDEATALAAGHRPCFECRRAAAKAFATAWSAGNGGPLPRAAAMDEILHKERLAGRARRLHPLPGPLDALPDGAMLATGGTALLRANGGWHRWTFTGYKPAERPDAVDSLLTPPSSLAALRAGYRPVLHPSAG